MSGHGHCSGSAEGEKRDQPHETAQRSVGLDRHAAVRDWLVQWHATVHRRLARICRRGECQDGSWKPDHAHLSAGHEARGLVPRSQCVVRHPHESNASTLEIVAVKDGEDRTDAETPRPATTEATRLERKSAPVIAQPTPAALAADEVLSERYKIVRLIAHGGMGEVYEALDLELRTPVALKTIRPELVTENMVERFRRELYLARQVTHPNVCRLFDLGRHNAGKGHEIVFLTMELLGGETLAKLLKRVKRTSLEETLPIVRQIAAAIDAAHAAGVVHRDLKPGNVMLVPPRDNDPDREVRALVTDFGVAHGSSDPFSEVSGTGDVVGSPAYMAPEQLEGAQATPAADIYALGLIVYEMVTGVRAFQGESSLSAVVKRLKTPPPPPRTLVPDLEPRWELAILRCLEIDPTKRFASAKELVRALDGTPTPMPTPVPTSVPPSVPVSVATRRRARWPLIAGAAVLLAGGGLVTWKLARRDPTSRAAPVVADASGRRSVAVIGFKNLSARPDAAWLSTAITESISIDLAAGDRLRTISGEAVARARIDLALSDAESYTSETLAKIRALTGADLVIIGSYLTLGTEKTESLRINVRLQDTRTGETVIHATEVETIGSLSQIITRIDSQVRTKLGVDRASERDQQAARAAMPSHPDALRLYSEGLAKLRVFDAVGARALLIKAAEIEPEQPMIQSVLAQASLAVGADPEARAAAKRANDGAGSLPSFERRVVAARYHEVTYEWEKAVAIYKELTSELPEDLELGLLLATAQVSAEKPAEATATLERLRKLPAPSNEDPRIDLAEAAIGQSTADYVRAEAVSAGAAKKAEQLGARLLLGHARLSQGRALYYMGNHDASIVVNEEAKNIFAAAGDRSNEARASNNLANSYIVRGKAELAIQLYEHAIAIHRANGDRKRLGGALINLAQVHYDRGDLKQVDAVNREALQLLREVGDTARVVLTLANLADQLRTQGDVDGALAALAEAEALRKPDDLRNQELILVSRGQNLTQAGQIEPARRALEESIEVCRKANALGDLADAQSFLALNRIEAGAYADARVVIDASIKGEIALGQDTALVRARAFEAQLILAEGRAADAEKAAELAAAEAAKLHLGYSRLESLTPLVRARLAQGKHAEARAALDQLRALALQGLYAELTVALLTAQVEIAKGAKPTAELARIRDAAAKTKLSAVELEARLALARITGDNGALAAVAKEAEARGAMRIARLAAAK